MELEGLYRVHYAEPNAPSPHQTNQLHGEKSPWETNSRSASQAISGL